MDASRPNALPPDSNTALTLSFAANGFNSPPSRLAGPPPRISTPHVAPLSVGRITVHPVAPSVYSAFPILKSVSS